MNKYSKFILKLSIQICFMLVGLYFFLHIFSPYATSYISLIYYINSVKETIGGVFLVGIICSLMGDLILRKDMGAEKEEASEENDEK